MIALVHRYSGMIGIAGSLFGSCAKEIRGKTIFSLESLVQAHYRLSESSLSLGEIWEAHILLLIATCFIICVSESYKLYFTFQYGLGIQYAIVKMCWICVCLDLCWQIVSACGQCNKQVIQLFISL